MTTNEYPEDILDPEEDDGTMPANVEQLRESVVGRKIVSVERTESVRDWWRSGKGLTLVLDDGRRVTLRDTDDCCAYTVLDAFLLHPERIDHVITGVATEDGYSKWHIFADMGDVLELTVGWSSGNPFYYGYGFNIEVEKASA